MKFTEFDFNENIQRGIESAGFKECMPVQEETFRTIFNDQDVFAQSQTGTGKTAAFLIPIFQLLTEDKRFKGRKALIICPTRELVVQIEKEARILGQYLDFQVGSFYGGVGYNEQDKMLEKGCDILIGTPGRLIDYGKNGRILFSEIGILVIDEADRLFDMGFLPDIRKILNKMPSPQQRRTMLFSATLNAKVGNISWEYMNNPGEIIIEPEQLAVEAIVQELYHVSAEEKMSLLLGILNKEKPETGIVFANTKHTSYEVAKRLKHNGYHAKCLMGDLPQKKRLKILEEAKQGKTPFLVATDVAARGLHIDDLSIVVNYDVPVEAENYIHRIGRTARAGKSGKAITLACEKFVYGLSAIEKLTGQKIPVVWADKDLLIEDKSAGMRFHFDRHDGDYQGRRDDRARGNDRNRSGKSSSYRGNRKPLDLRAARVQSAVKAVSGSSLDFIEQENQSRNLGLNKGPNRSKNKKHPVYKGQRPTDTRSRNRKGFHAPASIAMERVSSKNTVEDRLAYYKAKYGEDFSIDGKSSANSNKAKPSRNKSYKPKTNQSDKSGMNSGKQRPAGKAGLKGQGSKGNHLPNTPKIPKPAEKSPSKNMQSPVVSKKKKGLLSRLFGK